MSGSVMTFNYDDGLSAQSYRGGVSQVQASWTSDSSAGTASGTTRKIVGRLVKVVTVPGSPTPTNNYTVTLTDGNGVNLLTSCDKTLAANQSSSSAQETYLLVKSYDGSPVAVAVHPAVGDKLTLAVSGAGNSTQGQIFLYYEPVAA
jgi:hypothetical protein